MTTEAIIGGLCAAIVAMAGLIGYILKDAIARNDKLSTRMEEQNKVVYEITKTLDKAMLVVADQQKLYEAINELKAVAIKDELKAVKEELRVVRGALEDDQPQKRGTGR